MRPEIAGSLIVSAGVAADIGMLESVGLSPDMDVPEPPDAGVLDPFAFGIEPEPGAAAPAAPAMELSAPIVVVVAVVEPGSAGAAVIPAFIAAAPVIIG